MFDVRVAAYGHLQDRGIFTPQNILSGQQFSLE